MPLVDFMKLTKFWHNEVNMEDGRHEIHTYLGTVPQ